MTRSRKPPASPSEDHDTAINRGGRSLLYIIDFLDKRIRDIAEGRAEKTRHDPESRVAHLGRQMVMIIDSDRKLKAMQAKEARSLTLAQVMAFLRQQPADERARVVRELQSLDKRGGVLG